MVAAVTVVWLLAMLAAPSSSKNRATSAQIRRAAGSKSINRLKELVGTGWTVEDLNSMASQDGKSAVHMAAWQGTIENLDYLLSLGCPIDTIATGQYSYGKTPIFFAATRSRNDVVQYLLQRGAFVKIVNNKGQSLLSIASSHLVPSLVQAIKQQEHSQRDREWWNFRETHSDGLEYGDLDPRFVGRPLRDSDVVTEFAINPTTRQSRRGSFLRRNPHLIVGTDHQIRSKCKPKTQKNQFPLVSDEELDRLEASWKRIKLCFETDGNMLEYENDLLTIVRVGDKQRKAWIPEAAERIRKYSTGKFTGIIRLIDSVSSKSSSARESSLLTKLLQSLEDPSAYRQSQHGADQRNKSKASPIKAQENISKDWTEAFDIVNGLSMLFFCTDKGILQLPNRPIWVDNMEMMQSLIETIRKHRLLALDTEWSTSDTGTNCIATLQIAVRDGENSLKTWVVDSLVADTSYQTAAKDLVREIFSGRYLLLGFAFRHDLPKLENLAGFRLVHTVLDVQSLASCANREKFQTGLRATVAQFSPIPLSKDEQCSNWSQRPLRTSQLDYAGLDAAILLVLLAESGQEVTGRCTTTEKSNVDLC